MSNRKPKTEEREDVLLRIDKQTAAEMQKISELSKMNLKEVARWLTWLGRKSFGRKVTIEEGKKKISISLEDYDKISQMDLN